MYRFEPGINFCERKPFNQYEYQWPVWDAILDICLGCCGEGLAKISDHSVYRFEGGSIFVNASPLIYIHQWGWGAPTSSPFELPFLVQVWDVVGKTWLKSEINQSTSLSLASFVVHISPALIFLNVCPFNEKTKKKNKWRRGALTNSQFERPFWIYASVAVGKAWPKYRINQCTGLSRGSIFVNASPLININKWRRGAHASSQFELPFLVHVWGVVGKTWPKYEVNPSSGLSLASIFVILCPLIRMTNEDGELKPVTGLSGHFGYFSGVLRGRPGQNFKSFGGTVWVRHRFWWIWGLRWFCKCVPFKKKI